MKRIRTYSYTLTLWENLPLAAVKACLNGWLQESCLSLVYKGEGVYLLTLREYAYPRKLVDRMDRPLWSVLKMIHDETYDNHTACGYEGSCYHVQEDGPYTEEEEQSKEKTQ